MSNPKDQEVIAEIERVKAAGLDPFGDDELDNPTLEADEDPADEQDIDPENPDETTDETVTEEALAPTVPTYTADIPADYQDQRTVLLKEKAEAMKKLMEGDLSSDDFAEIESRVSNALEDLTAQRIRAETLREANIQNQAAQQQAEIKKLIQSSKDEVDYLKDPRAQKQFDMALTLARQDSDNDGLGFDALVAQAHKMVMALRGVKSKPEQVADAVIANARRPKEAAPVTLRGLPAAATANSNGSVTDQMGRLTGQAYQEAFAKLSPSQRRALVDEE